MRAHGNRTPLPMCIYSSTELSNDPAPLHVLSPQASGRYAPRHHAGVQVSDKRRHVSRAVSVQEHEPSPVRVKNGQKARGGCMGATKSKTQKVCLLLSVGVCLSDNRSSNASLEKKGRANEGSRHLSSESKLRHLQRKSKSGWMVERAPSYIGDM